MAQQEANATLKMGKTTSTKGKEGRQKEEVIESVTSKGDEEISKKEGIPAKEPISKNTQETRVATPANTSPLYEIGQAEKIKKEGNKSKGAQLTPQQRETRSKKIQVE